jgi:hypothetical protein
MTYKKRKGMLVRIMMDGHLETGVYLRSEKVFGVRTPVFQVGKKLVRGWAIWWLPSEVASKVEAKFGVRTP